METVEPKPKRVDPLAIAKEVVDRYATRFGFGHYSFKVKLMPKSLQANYYALCYFDHEEEFFEVEVVPDGTLPARQLEYVVVHEMAHGLLSFAAQHSVAEEVICNRVARAITRTRGPNEKLHPGNKLGVIGQPAANGAFEPLRALVDTLPDREREVLSRIYFGRASLQEVGKELNLGKRQVARIRDRALARISEAIITRSTESG